MKLLRWIALLLRIVLFALLLLFAAKNTELVTLVLLALLFFAMGAGLGVLACLGSLFRQRREILALKRQLTAGTSSTGAHNASATSLPAGQPPIDGVV
jgi:uncharacterized integral membrane protein